MSFCYVPEIILPEIVLDDISFSYGSRRVLDQVSLRVSNGERAFLVGPNGVGKSTLLKIVSGDVTPDSGSVISGVVSQCLPDPQTFDGSVAQFVDVALMPLKKLLARFEQVTESIAIGQTLLASEYDQILAQLNCLDAWSVDRRVDETFDRLNLAEFMGFGGNRSVATLSPDQRARQLASR
ncbi:MAG: ATP-binding cassette domain-containing protein [Actinomycetaceae bacterium]|nr:ATP-binding cassette domain-containing protein [Actinomycetaceae bacterium]